jgi:hypothetical protein
MKIDDFDMYDPFNLGFEHFTVYVTIGDPFVGIVGAKVIRGRVVKIKMMVGPDRIQWIPNGGKIGIWTKGRPADVEYEQIPKELRIVDIRHVEKIEVTVHT